MKSFISMVLCFLLIFSLSGCGDNVSTAPADETRVIQETEDLPEGDDNNMDTTTTTEKRITMTVADMPVSDRTISIILYDTPAANALYEMLPLELTFEDFNNVEKISYLPSELPTEGEPDSCDPDVGDLCLYKPWGNLSIFYEDFRESSGLINLGHIESGMDTIAAMDTDFTVTLEVEE